MTTDAWTREGPAWFVEPDSAFRLSTYWFWHREPTRPEIETQLRQIFDGGFRTVLIQARMAYPQDKYLDDDYLAAYAYAVRIADQLGLDVGIYDEYSWMSGQACGRTVAGHDHLRERHLFWAEVAGGSGEATISGINSPFIDGLGDAGRRWVYEGGRPVWQDWEVVAAVASRGDGEHRELSLITDRVAVALAVPDGCRFRIEAPPGDGWTVTIFAAARCATSRMINYLLPEAAQRFTEVVHDRYRESIGPEFSSLVRYMFLDHPYNGFYAWNERCGHTGCSILYDRSFGETLARNMGMEPGLALLALVHDSGPSDAWNRARLFEIYQSQLHESFFGTLRRWCDRHGVGLAGHELLAHVGGWGLNDGFGRLDTRTTLGTDYFGIERFRTHTTVDASNFEPQLAPKFGDSVARAHGRSRCIIEQYATGRGRGASSAAGQWDLTLETLRRQAIRHHFLGARQFLMHAFYQTDGWPGDLSSYSNPRFDFAPGVNFEPWYALHADFAVEMARVSAFLEAEPWRSVALFYPLETLRRHGMRHPCTEEFGRWARLLSETGCGFDIVDEAMLGAARIADGALMLGDRRYDTVILPGQVAFRDGATFHILDRLIDAGGRIFASELAPPHQASGEPAAAAARVAAGIDARPATVELTTQLASASPGPHALAGDGLPLWQWSGTADDGWRFATVNDTDAPRAITLVAPVSRTAFIERFIPGTGAVTSFEGDWFECDGRLRVEIVLEPNELACLRFGSDVQSNGSKERDPAVPRQHGEVVSVQGGEPIELRQAWTLAFDPSGTGAPVMVTHGWEQQGFPDTVGKGIYRCTVDLDGARYPGAWRLELPGVHTAAEAFVNGRAVGRRGWAPYVFAIPAGLLKPAANRIEIHVYSTAGNHYYAGTPYSTGLQPCGLTAPPLLRPMETEA